jgi:spore coat polysaccharide biosynthesis protein SpsF (cytidylyltransferase family)
MRPNGKVVAVVQARLGSNRLPGKALLALAGRPMLDHVLERACATPGVTEVILATGPAQRDVDALWPIAIGRGCRCRAEPPEPDVLRRVYCAADWAHADTVLRITADCPFWAPDVAAAVLEQFPAAAVDYLSNDTARSGYPDGTDVEVFTMAALRQAHFNAREQADREHVTPWIRRELRTGMMHYLSGDFSWMKLSVDKREDYDRATRLVDGLPPHDLSLSATLAAYARLEPPR